VVHVRRHSSQVLTFVCDIRVIGQKRSVIEDANAVVLFIFQVYQVSLSSEPGVCSIVRRMYTKSTYDVSCCTKFAEF
jgi:hypothetical protein